MNLRVSLQTSVNQAISYEQQQTASLSRLEQQASSGNRILAPEDDPLGAVAVINYSTQVASYDTDLSNINTATTNLNVSVSTLQDAGNILSQAKQLAIEGANPANDSSALTALGNQVDALLKQFVTDANAQNNGQYVFGGTKSDKPPFSTDSSGNVTYAGSAQRATIPVGSSQTVDTFYSGSEVFQGGATGAPDAFKVLAGLRDTLRNTAGLSQSDQAQALTSSLDQLTQVSNNILRVAGEQSATLQNLNGLQSHVQDVQLQTKQLSGDVSSADIASVMTNLQAQQNLLQATLETTAQMFSQSLLNYIK